MNPPKKVILRLLLPPLSQLSPHPVPPPPSSLISSLTELLLSCHPSLPPPHLLLPHLSSSPLLLPSILSSLFSSHSPSLLSLNLFLFSLSHPLPFPPSPSSFHSTLLTLSRSRHFSHAISLFHHLSLSHPHSHLLSPHSLSLFLTPLAKSQPFPNTLHSFQTLQAIFHSANHPFGVDHFNALLRAFSSQGRMAEARSLFNRFHTQFPPNSKTLNILLLGFRRAGNLLAFEVFYNEMLVRGFEPDVVSFNIRMDAYCKKNRFSDAVEVFEEMERKGFRATVETMTTLIHGAGIARNVFRARKVFDEIGERGLVVDRGAYNALMGAVVRVGDLDGGRMVMDEMEGKGIGVDDVGYYTMFCGLRRKGGGDLEGFCEVYQRMIDRGFVPRVRTVMLLMKFFCESRRSSDLGLGLWDYLVGKGCCPHRHALDLLVTGLCCSNKVEEAYRCFKQVVEKGRRPSDRTVMLLEGVFKRLRKKEKLGEMKKMMEGLKSREEANCDEDEEDCIQQFPVEVK